MGGFLANPVTRLKVILTALAAVVLGLGLAAYGNLPGGRGAANVGSAGPVAGSSGDTVTSAQGLGADTIADIVARTSPAVVKIETVVQGQSDKIFAGDPLLRQFFGNDFPFGSQVEQGVGSGFLMSPDGYILTNDHVVSGASSILVTVAGRSRAYQAQAVDQNYSLDLALVKIDAGSDLPTLTMGDSDQSRVGDWVVAIGNPYGLDHTVTVGVLSAKARPVTVGNRQYSNLLQTDASINPGNSGGPLLNLAGQVIGINTAVGTAAQGIGFAIPTSTVKPVLDNWVSHKPIAFLGVQLSGVPSGTAAGLNLPDGQGALVAGVVPGSPAAKAGLSPGDVITRFNGGTVNGPDDLMARIQGERPGAVARLTVIRNGASLGVQATLGSK
ncbi:MAG: trypsin-like peptidase domain-containing protein [Peptococcaceae bacterium]|jgi:S1-C subfamily serine protease|nr:trypsin-like peptidase domain-containing protein [Peptococcaceae bacterium]